MPSDVSTKSRPRRADSAPSTASRGLPTSARHVGDRDLAFLFWLWKVAMVLLIILLFFAFLLGAVSVGVFFVRRTVVQQETLLWALAIAAERSLPMAPAILAFVDQYGNTFRWRIQLLAGLLIPGLVSARGVRAGPEPRQTRLARPDQTRRGDGHASPALRDAVTLDPERIAW